MPELSFLIPVRNDASRLKRCLETIRRSAGDLPTQIVVGDNGSTDDTARVATAAGAQVVNVAGLQVSEIRNVLAGRAQSSLLAFIDADHEVTQEWCGAALSALRDATVVAAGDQYHSPGQTWVQRAYDLLRRRPDTPTETEWIPSGNLVVRRDAFSSVGGFDISLATCEDVDLCQRLNRTGGRVLAVPQMKSVHLGDPSTLGSVFRGELWRGRDAVRLALRSKVNLSSIKGLVMPVLTLLGLLLVIGGGLACLFGGPVGVPLVGLVVFLLPVGALSLVLLRRRQERPNANVAVGQLLALATTYTTARGVAPLFPGGHNLRRKD